MRIKIWILTLIVVSYMFNLNVGLLNCIYSTSDVGDYVVSNMNLNYSGLLTTRMLEAPKIAVLLSIVFFCIIAIRKLENFKR